MTKRIEAKTKTQKIASRLAVSYSAYNQAEELIRNIYTENDDDKLLSIVVWANSLLEAQKEAKFELYRTSLLESRLEMALDRREVLRRAAEAAQQVAA